ncbi:hypothetical protein BCR44DRAFT_258493 [Catenaria anguillulae PL171]|uniref:Uncharacterized protein n=1 Tax=Catenaria anguillulae PL171 TaxID=765915 RepID=A0A1Y2H229_9FUNG|nr:hypothetical protein BCR44DRAFT_258493 [Catenaria anguillulae PL171]
MDPTNSSDKQSGTLCLFWEYALLSLPVLLVLLILFLSSGGRGTGMECRCTSHGSLGSHCTWPCMRAARHTACEGSRLNIAGRSADWVRNPSVSTNTIGEA